LLIPYLLFFSPFPKRFFFSLGLLLARCGHVGQLGFGISVLFDPVFYLRFLGREHIRFAVTRGDDKQAKNAYDKSCRRTALFSRFHDSHPDDESEIENCGPLSSATDRLGSGNNYFKGKLWLA
jgi:hypothetical protein